MFHATSGRQDNDALMDGGVHFTKACCCGKLLEKGWGLVQVVGSVMQKGQSWLMCSLVLNYLGARRKAMKGKGIKIVLLMPPSPMLLSSLLLLLLLLVVQVTVLTPTGAQVELSVPTSAGPRASWQDFGAEQFADLARKALSQQV